MKRRDFIQMAGLGAGAMMLPFTGFGQEVDLAHMLTPLLSMMAKDSPVNPTQYRMALPQRDLTE